MTVLCLHIHSNKFDNFMIQDTEEESDSANVTSVDVQTLCTDSRQNRCKELVRLKPIKESIEERCIEALKFIHTVSFKF